MAPISEIDDPIVATQFAGPGRICILEVAVSGKSAVDLKCSAREEMRSGVEGHSAINLQEAGIQTEDTAWVQQHGGCLHQGASINMQVAGLMEPQGTIGLQCPPLQIDAAGRLALHAAAECQGAAYNTNPA